MMMIWRIRGKIIRTVNDDDDDDDNNNNNNNNNNNTNDNVYGAVIVTQSLREFTRFI